MFFRSRKPRLSKAEALATRPFRTPGAELIASPDGGGKIKMAWEPRPWAKRFLGAKSRINKSYELDSLGVMVWNACDGKTSVQQVIRKLAKEYNFNLREAEVSTLAFLQMLLKKGLILMPLKTKK